MIVAGKSYYEIDQLCQRRMRWSYLVSSAFFALLAVITPPECVPEPLRPRFVGHAGPMRVTELLTRPDRPEAQVEAMAARWLASGALRVIDFVIVEEEVARSAQLPTPTSRRTHAPTPRRGPTVSIGQIVPIERVQVEIELDENLAARTTTRPGARREDFAILNMVRPAYPQVSLWAEVEGLLTLKATVSPLGRVIRVVTLSNEADGFCEEVASMALLQWEFRPIKLDGQPVWFSVVVPFRFTLTD
jgi:TonB family protein